MSNSQTDYLGYRIERSEELFQDAQLLYDNKRWRSCINRLYYSAFHLVSALMAKHGIEPKSHDGLKTMFFQHYIKPKLSTLIMVGCIHNYLTGDRKAIMLSLLNLKRRM